MRRARIARQRVLVVKPGVDVRYAVDEVETPSIMDPAQGWFDVAVHEIRETLGPLAREHGSETIQQIFEHYCRIGRVVDADGYRAGLARRRRRDP